LAKLGQNSKALPQTKAVFSYTDCVISARNWQTILTDNSTTISDKSRQQVHYTRRVGHWRIQDEQKWRKCKDGGTRLTILPD